MAAQFTAAAPSPVGLPPGRRRHGRWTPYLLLLPGMGWLALFFVTPVFTLVSQAMQTRPDGAPVGYFRQTWNVRHYWTSLQEYWPWFARSFGYALVATIVALAIAFPLAYAIAFKSGRAKNLLLVLVVAPFFVSFILRTIAWKQILADQGPVVSMLQTVGLLGDNGRILSTPVAVLSGIIYNFLPFMTLPIYASLERMDRRLTEAASDLYANGWASLRKVTVPLAMPGIIAGTLLTFIPAAGDYINAALLGNRDTAMIGNVIDARFLRLSDYPTAAALSLVLMVSILVIVGVYVRRTGTEELV